MLVLLLHLFVIKFYKTLQDKYPSVNNSEIFKFNTTEEQNQNNLNSKIIILFKLNYFNNHKH